MSLILLGERYRPHLDAPLRELGLNPLYLPYNPMLDPRLAGHADLSVFPAGERIWLSPQLKGTEIHEMLHEFGYFVDFPNISEGILHPADAHLNLCAVGKHLFFSPKASTPEIVEFLTISEGYQPIPVKQAYLRCAMLPADEESIITADPGVAKAARAAGLQVLQIEPGHVALEGFASGFLGGAGFLLPEQKLAVLTGRLERHPDKGRIEAFLRERGLALHTLTDKPIFDIGSAFVLAQL
jgi:hypothetical protein